MRNFNTLLGRNTQKTNETIQSYRSSFGKVAILSILMVSFLVFFNTKANAQCTFTLRMTDTYGDGWNGGTVKVSVANVNVMANQTISSGYGPIDVTFSASTGQSIRVYYTAAGSYLNEMRVQVLNSVGVVVLATMQPLSGTQSSGGTSFTASCPAPLPGENCTNAIDLATLTSPISATTVGYANDIATCRTGFPDRVYYRDVVNGATITFQETTNNYDEWEYIGYGSSCTATTQIQCWDNDGLAATTWTNSTGSTQRVWYVQDAYSGSGTFTLSWTVVAPVTSCSGTPAAGTATITSATGCPSVSFTLNSSGLSTGTGITYQWQTCSTSGGTYANVGAAGSSLTTSTATTAYYKLKTTCSGSGSINTTNVVSYTLIAAPTSVTATPNSICAGATTNLNATTASTSISWYTVSTGGIAIGSSASGVNFPLTPSVSTTYYAASNTAGCESTRTSVAVTVNSPVITTQPVAPASFCGGSGTATVSVTATSGVTYQWLRNGVAISAAPYSNFTTSTLTITNPSAGENGVALTCVVYAAGATCPVTSLPVSLVVSSAPAVPSPVTATSSAICVGQSSLLNATSAGNYINWYSALTSGTLLTSVPSASDYSVTPAVTTTYYAESVLTNVGVPQTATFNYTGAITTWTVPAGVSSINIDCMGAQGGSQPEFNWGGRGARVVGNSIPVTPGQVIKILVGQAGTNGSADDGCGGGGGSFVTTSANAPLVIAGGGGGDGADQAGVAASLTTTSTANGDASVAGSVAPNGGGANDGSGGGGLSGNGSNGTSTTSGGLSFTNGGTGGVGLRNGGFGGGGAGGTSTEGAGGGSGYAGGPGGSGGADAGGGGSSYCIVSPATSTATQTGNGSVVITYTPVTFGCTSSPRQAVTVTVNTLPIITTQPTTPANICGPGTATTSIVASNAVSYQWFKNGVAISALPYSNYTTSTLTITNPSVGENGAVLTCVVYAAGGSCPVTSLPVSLVVGNMPAAPSAVTATNSAICVGQSSLLNATSAGNYINWYSALTSGTLLTSVPSATNYSVTPAVTTTYYAESVLTNVGVPQTATFNYTGAITTWTVPAGVSSINVTARGAQGGTSTGTGGLGANMTGTFAVTPGQVFSILAGQQPAVNSYPGGGGGTYVALGASYATATPLIVAGGGGGAQSGNGDNASIATSGNGPLPGTAGNGAASSSCGGGGGGFFTSGGNDAIYGTAGAGGAGFRQGGAGGVSTSGYGTGGFGGGATADYVGSCNVVGGSGGGYSGGSGTGTGYQLFGYGGGSYNAGTSQTNTVGNTGNGSVVISYTPVTFGCTSTPRQAVTVTVNTLPIITTQPTTPANICGPGTATTSIVASNAVSYQWFRNGVSISALPYSNYTTSTLTITNPSVGENGAVLTCVVYAAGASCPVTSLPVSLVVGSMPAAPSVVTATNSAICSGQTSNLTATSSSNSINWYNASSVLLTTLPVGTPYAVSPGATTTYYAASSDATVGSTTFNYTGSIQTYTVPAGVTSLHM